ncbi:MAG: YiiX/YebB-like N1pC/P60 family cysteine hydrolase, partial [Akkermansiaceae bacterium]
MWRSRVGYRCYSLLRRGHSGYVKAMFHLFRISGSAIAGKRNPFQMSKHAGKRVTSKTLKEISKILRPGDIIVTRHDNALSNHFFPGYWPHAALFLGTPAMRRDLSLPTKGSNKENVLEAKKDGVKLRQLAETLSVDAFVVLRPDEEKTDIAAMLAKALTHEGKLYDFLFDFRKAERLACTEVIYRSFHGVGDWRLELIKQSGRLTLPAEELIRQSLENRFARVEAIFGANGCPLLRGQEAKAVLERTLGRE